MSIEKIFTKTGRKSSKCQKTLKPESGRPLAKATKLAGFSQRAVGLAGMKAVNEKPRPLVQRK